MFNVVNSKNAQKRRKLRTENLELILQSREALLEDFIELEAKVFKMNFNNKNFSIFFVFKSLLVNCNKYQTFLTLKLKKTYLNLLKTNKLYLLEIKVFI